MNHERPEHVPVKPLRLAAFDRPTPLGSFHVVCYEFGNYFAFAVSKGSFPSDELVVRVQSPCLFGESFFVNSCDCGTQLSMALTFGAELPSFLLIYSTDQEGRGIGMRKKIIAIEREVNGGMDMVEAFQSLHFDLDERDYGVAAHIIRDLNGNRPIRLLTNNPKKMQGLKDQDIEISERLPLVVDPPNIECERYLKTKRVKMGHLLPDLKFGGTP